MEWNACTVDGLLQMLQPVPLGKEEGNTVLEVPTKGLPGCCQCARQELLCKKQALPSDDSEACLPMDKANTCDHSRSRSQGHRERRNRLV